MKTNSRRGIAAFLVLPCAMLLAQTPPPPAAQTQAAQPLLSPQQLDNLVAPVALYPDPLLGQVLAAATYPLEVVEAQQWLQQNANLHGTQLMDAARQQNWDPSVQALVAFPDVMATLNRDVRWTTDLGNAFLAQQNDVMAAVQRMRARARQNGRLSSTPQQTVTTEQQNGQSAVVIEPTDPQVIYVPSYNPMYVWGPPAWGYYPPLWYPGIGFGFGFGPGIYLGGFFPGWGGLGWGLGWGWGCGWFGGGIFLNSFFFNHYGFRGGFGGGFGGGRAAWQHDPYHRAGVAYGNRNVAARYNNARFAAGRSSAGARSTTSGFNRSGTASRGFNGSSSSSRSFASSNRAGAGATNRYSGQAGRSQGYSRSYSSPGSRGSAGSSFGGAARSYSAPRSNYAAPRSSGGATGSYSAPRSSGGASRSFSGGGHSSGGGRSSGGRR